MNVSTIILCAIVGVNFLKTTEIFLRQQSFLKHRDEK